MKNRMPRYVLIAFAYILLLWLSYQVGGLLANIKKPKHTIQHNLDLLDSIDHYSDFADSIANKFKPIPPAVLHFAQKHNTEVAFPKGSINDDLSSLADTGVIGTLIDSMIVPMKFTHYSFGYCLKPVYINEDSLTNASPDFFLIFTKEVDIRNCHFFPDKAIDPKFDRCYFSELQFDSLLSFEENFYHCPVEFSKCYFNDAVEIDEIRPFTLEFTNSTFRKELKVYSPGRSPINLEFSSTIFHGNLDLSYCVFDSLSGLKMYNTTLPDTLDLTRAKTLGSLDLLDANPPLSGKPCEIDLMNAPEIVEHIKMNYRYFHLYIPDPIKTRPEYHDLVSNLYESLLANFKRNGYVDGYEQLDIEYKLWQCRNNKLLLVQYYWWIFGYKKWMILIWTAGFCLLFSILNFWNFQKMQLTYPVEKLSGRFREYRANPVERYLRRYFIVLLYTGFIFFKINIDFKNINFKSIRYAVFLVLQYVVGLICTGFLVNWILKS